MEDNNEDIIYASSVFNDSSNEINQNASTPSASVNIVNIFLF